MTQAQYPRHRNKSPQYIAKLAKAGIPVMLRVESGLNCPQNGGLPLRFLLYPPISATGMGIEQRKPTASRPFVEWFAGRISDPVVRLRFLKAVAPPLPAGPRVRRRSRVVIGLLPLVLVVVLGFGVLVRAVARVAPVRAPVPRISLPAVRAQGLPDVWLVEKTGDSETYSNGLRIDNRFAIANHPRLYLAFPAGQLEEGGGQRRTDPVGIVFHTTESRQAPFEARQSGVLKRIGESLLDYVRRKRAYHFLIDRFGRVYRVVTESHAANHAGFSVWSDENWLYLNLNESFLGVSFEAQTQPGQVEAPISPAQVRAAAMLTEMLRGRYGIPAANCVTHAQVSVNPSNMRAGYHTDWASNFPFEQLGLPNNYARALPALSAFGFECDPGFLRRAGARLYAGVELAEESLRARAAESGLSLLDYRRVLRKRYRERLAELRRCSSNEEEEFE